MPKEELRRLQERRLRAQLRRVYESSPLHHQRFREASVTPDEIRGVEDLRRLPLVTREDLQRAVKDSGDFYGGRLCVPADRLILSISPPEWPFVPLEDIPVVTALTVADQREVVELLTRIWVMEGVAPKDLVQVQCWAWEAFGFAFSFPSHTFGLTSVGGVLGCRIIPQELFVPDVPRTIHTGRFFKPDVLFTTETALATLESYLTPVSEGEKVTVEVAVSETTSFKVVKEEEFSPCSIGYRVIVLRAPFYELFYANEEKRGRIKEVWGVEDVFTLLDIQDILFYASDCAEHCGLHVWEDAFVVEVIDAAGECVSAGEWGDLVLTNIFAEATPLIRYKTGITATFEDERCGCGRTHRRIFLRL
ncbi:phenylacetate--CoA ligase family protein [Candidatus Alkanophaga liquidiphilum]